MRPNISSASNKVLVGRIQMPDITALQDEEDDPVDTRDYQVQGERRSDVAVLSPYCMAVMAMFAVCGGVEGIVQCSNHNKEPGDDGQDFVCYQGTSVELGTLRKWVVYCKISSAPTGHTGPRALGILQAYAILVLR